jgi:hypothetical protein
MTKKQTNILFGLLSFVIGVLLAWLTIGQIRSLIRTFYQWTTGDAFQFHGKHLIINLDPIYYIVFGLAILTLWICLKHLTLKEILLWATIWGLTFLTTMVVYSWIDGNLRVISCTMCDDGIVSLGWNDLDYNLITELSILLGLTPLIIWTMKKRKRASVRQNI